MNDTFLNNNNNFSHNLHTQVIWFFEDEPIAPGSDLMIETTDTYTSLRIQVAKNYDCQENGDDDKYNKIIPTNRIEI